VVKEIRGVKEIQPEICEINKSEKQNLCNWLCEHGCFEDFVNFKSVFELIEEITGLSNQEVVLPQDDDIQIVQVPLSAENQPS
jgi:hypothetical protein